MGVGEGVVWVFNTNGGSETKLGEGGLESPRPEKVGLRGENNERNEVEGMRVDGHMEIGVGCVVGGMVVGGFVVWVVGRLDFRSRSSSSNRD